MSKDAKIEFRRLAPHEHGAAHRLILGLRPHLDEAKLAALIAKQAEAGYELVGAFIGDDLVGVAGIRPVSTLVRGPHLHLDDLVIHDKHRRSGIGARFLRFLEEDARRRNLGKLFLDARPEAIAFYERNGYAFNAAPLMKKDL